MVDRWEAESSYPPSKALFENRTALHQCPVHGKTECYQLKTGRAWDETYCQDCRDEEHRKRRADDDRRAEADGRRREERNYQIRIAQANIPARLMEESLQTYKEVSPEAAKHLQACRDYAINFEQNLRAGTSLILCGTTGTGKTHLAIGICHEVLKSRHVRYVTCLKALRSIKETYSRGSEKSEQQAINEFVRPDLLVLDEVGVQFGTDAERNIIFEIINERYEALKPTILISNLSLSSLEEVIGARVIDRMKENGGKIMVCRGESYRPKKL